jgi:hypothetical protein
VKQEGEVGTASYYIMDRQGRQIGVWYSSLTAGITVDPDSKKEFFERRLK